MRCWKVSSVKRLSNALGNDIVPPFSTRALSTSSPMKEQHSCRLLVIGGGAGGCSTAAKFASKLGKNKVIVIDPSDRHYYQPMFTLIGAGIKDLDQSYRPMKCVLPKEAHWLKDRVTKIEPRKNKVTTEKGDVVEYDYMVVAMGVELNFNKIPGLCESLDDPKSGVCSIYSPEYVNKTYDCLKRLKHGNAIFTYPNAPVKCAGAPQKIAYLAAHHCQLKGLKDVQVHYHTALPVIFKAPHYAKSLWKVAEKRNVKVHLNSDLIEIRPNKKEAVFVNLENPSVKVVQEYSMLHVTPPQYASPVISQNKDLSDSSGFVEVDKGTMQHVRFPNIFGVGDCTNLPTSKTGAAVAGQLGVLRKNLAAVMEGKKAYAQYDGYTSCPLVTGYGTCIMAEFDYNLTPLETFPVDQNKERSSMYHIKKEGMPQLYFNLMLRGLWEGPKLFRKMMHLGMSK